MIESGKIYTVKNELSILVLGYETQVVNDNIKREKITYESFCNRTYDNISIKDNTFLFDLLLSKDFTDLVLRYCNYFLLVYHVKDADNVLNKELIPSMLSLVSKLDYEELDISKIRELDEGKVKVWYLKNKMLFPQIYDYITFDEINKRLEKYSIKTKETFEKSKGYYYRVIFDTFSKDYPEIVVLKTENFLYNIDKETKKIYSVCDLNESMQQKIYMYMLAVSANYYNSINKDKLSYMVEENYKQVTDFSEL